MILNSKSHNEKNGLVCVTQIGEIQIREAAWNIGAKYRKVKNLLPYSLKIQKKMERVSEVLQKWILRHEKFTREKPYIARNGKSVSLDDILKEIQDDTEEGRKFVDGIISLAISMIVKDIEKLPQE